MKKLYFLSIIFIITSCGGGGGGGSAPTPIAIPFSITLGLSSFSVDEDQSYTGSIAATANENVTLQYAITEEPANGSLTLAADGNIFYSPSSNYFGSDQFKYSVTAVEKSVTENATVTITVNEVDDPPTASFIQTNYSKDTLIFEDELEFRAQVNDIDTDTANLSFTILIGSQEISGSFAEDVGENNNGLGTITFNLSSLEEAGLFDASVRVSDSASSTSFNFTSWFISNKTTVTIEQDDTPEDGFMVMIKH